MRKILTLILTLSLTLTTAIPAFAATKEDENNPEISFTLIPAEKDYSGSLKIDAMNSLSQQVEVTGDIEFGDTSINFTSERFSIKNGKGTFKTNSASAISLSRLLKGQTFKISNVKAGNAKVSVSPSSGIISNGTNVKITLTEPNVTTYTITWKNWNGSVLKTTKVNAGTKPSYGGTPTRPADSNKTYTFSGWTPAIVAANGNATYTAQYITNEYNRSIEINAVNSLKQPVEVTGNIELGDTSINFTSERFNIKNGKGTFKTTSQNTISLSRLLNGQTFKITNVKAGDYAATVTPSSGKLTSNASIKIILSEKPTYTITWKNWDGKVLGTSTVKQGIKPSYNGTLTKPADSKYTYTFTGWSPEVKAATSNATYTAQFKATAKSSLVSNAIPKVTIKAPGKAKASFTVKWTKLSKANQKKITGLQIQYSTSSKFNSNVKTINANKTAASKKVSKLKKKTTYYVRVRAYKKSGSLVAYGVWSGTKSVKTK